MNYAFMTFSVPEATLDEALAMAKKYGYAGIEPRAEAGHRHGVEIGATAEERKTVKKKAQAAGIAIACVATSCTYADPATAGENTRKTHEYIDLAADVGSSRVRVFGGQIGGGWSRERATSEVAAALASVADHARERGVVVCMETHDDWCDPNHVAEVMRRVGKPSIGVNWDIMHPVRAAKWKMADCLKPIGQWVHHVHLHDGVEEGGNILFRPIGQGAIDHATAVRLLLEAGYKDYLSGEWIGWSVPASEYLPNELKTMKGFEARR